MEDVVIVVQHVSKKYKFYPSHVERLKEIFYPFSKKYHRDFWALQDVSLKVSRGEIVGIIGQNGSGKSTLLQIICQLSKPTYGEIIVRGRIAALLELGVGFNPEFSGRDNAYMNGAIYGFSKSEMDKRMPVIEEFAEIGEFIDQPLKTYSSGMTVRLAFACTITVEPEILVIDEALSVGDVYFQQKCFKKIKSFRDEGKTILFVSHDAGAVKNLCHRAYLLDDGKIVNHGKPDDVFDYYNALLALKNQQDITIIEQKPESQNNRMSIIQEQSNDNNTLRAYRTGNRQIEIIDSYILVNGLRTELIESGRFVDVCIEALAHRDVPNVTFGILIKDRLGNDIFGTNTYHLNKKISIKENEKISIKFSGHLNIGHGEYTLTVGAHTEDTHLSVCYDWLDKILMFRVIPDIKYSFIGVAKLTTTISTTINH
jgi:lipopolysaccharide transport system ATP-binding protein